MNLFVLPIPNFLATNNLNSIELEVFETCPVVD